MNPKQKKYGEKYTKAQHNQKLKANGKEKILETMKENQFLYRGKHIRMFEVSSSETMNARRQWNNIFRVLKRKKKKALSTYNFLSCKNILQNDNKILSQTHKNWYVKIQLL